MPVITREQLVKALTQHPTQNSFLQSALEDGFFFAGEEGSDQLMKDVNRDWLIEGKKAFSKPLDTMSPKEAMSAITKQLGVSEKKAKELADAHGQIPSYFTDRTIKVALGGYNLKLKPGKNTLNYQKRGEEVVLVHDITHISFQPPEGKIEQKLKGSITLTFRKAQKDGKWGMLLEDIKTNDDYLMDLMTGKTTYASFEDFRIAQNLQETLDRGEFNDLLKPLFLKHLVSGLLIVDQSTNQRAMDFLINCTDYHFVNQVFAEYKNQLSIKMSWIEKSNASIKATIDDLENKIQSLIKTNQHLEQLQTQGESLLKPIAMGVGTVIDRIIEGNQATLAELRKVSKACQLSMEENAQFTRTSQKISKQLTQKCIQIVDIGDVCHKGIIDYKNIYQKDRLSMFKDGTAHGEVGLKKATLYDYLLANQSSPFLQAMLTYALLKGEKNPGLKKSVTHQIAKDLGVEEGDVSRIVFNCIKRDMPIDFNEMIDKWPKLQDRILKACDTIGQKIAALINSPDNEGEASQQALSKWIRQLPEKLVDLNVDLKFLQDGAEPWSKGPAN